MALTEPVPVAARPVDARDPANDPFRQWDAVTHQLGVVAPRKTERIRQIREAMLPAIKV